MKTEEHRRAVYVTGAGAGIAAQVRAAILAHELAGAARGVMILAPSADGKSVELVDVSGLAESRLLRAECEPRLSPDGTHFIHAGDCPSRPPSPPRVSPFRPIPPGRSGRDQAALNEAAARRLLRNAKRRWNACK